MMTKKQSKNQRKREAGLRSDSNRRKYAAIQAKTGNVVLRSGKVLMKLLLSFLFFEVSTPAIANTLLGEWVSCEAGKDGVDIEHHLIFQENNFEFEIHAFVERDKKGNMPCKGSYGLLLGTHWYYEDENSQFTSTAFSSYIILYKSQVISEFNKNRICGETNWKLGKRMKCTNDKYLAGEIPKKGKKTSHDYVLKGRELHIIENGKTLIYKENGN